MAAPGTSRVAKVTQDEAMDKNEDEDENEGEDENEDEDEDEDSVHDDTQTALTPASQSDVSSTANEHQQPNQTPNRPFSTRSTPLKPHPILSRFTALPRIEPWTKTHYKTLDKLYTTHLKHPALFNPSASPPTPLSNTNGSLLRQFLAATSRRYLGATFAAWGYSMEMTEELLVLCAVYMKLLSLDSIDDYEERSGRTIQMGDCVPGRTGDRITGEEVMRRLATVVLGEDVRRDEKAGRKIDRSQGLTIEWSR